MADHEDSGDKIVQSPARPWVQRPGLFFDHHLFIFSFRFPREYYPDRLLLHPGSRVGPGIRVRPLGSREADLLDLDHYHPRIGRSFGRPFLDFQPFLLIFAGQVYPFGIKYALSSVKKGSYYGPVPEEEM
jgi:hypothetical protein